MTELSPTIDIVILENNAPKDAIRTIYRSIEEFNKEQTQDIAEGILT